MTAPLVVRLRDASLHDILNHLRYRVEQREPQQALLREEGGQQPRGTETGGRHIPVSSCRCLETCARMSHPRSQATCQEHTEVSEDNIHAGSRVDSKPIGTCSK